MKRRKILTLLGLAPILPLLLGCHDPVPRGNTTVIVNVIDQDGNPLPGVSFNIICEDHHAFGGSIGTFTLTTETDNLGQYKFSQHVPKKTNWFYFMFVGNEKIKPTPNYHLEQATHQSYLEENGVYEILDHNDFEIPRGQWGDTMTFNFKFEKI